MYVHEHDYIFLFYEYPNKVGSLPIPASKHPMRSHQLDAQDIHLKGAEIEIEAQVHLTERSLTTQLRYSLDQILAHSQT